MCASQPYCRCALSVRWRRRCKLHERVLCVIYRSRFRVRSCDNPPPAYRVDFLPVAALPLICAYARNNGRAELSRRTRGSFARNLYLEAADRDRMNFNERGSRCFRHAKVIFMFISCNTKPMIDAKIPISKRFGEAKSNRSK